MKLQTIAALLLCASVATAASETTTAPAAQQAPVANASEIAPAPAAATSTAVVPTAQTPAKKWGVVLLNESYVMYNDAKDMSSAPVNTTNYIGASYKITSTEKLGLRQYYTYVYNPKSEKSFEISDMDQSFTVATISTKTKGILGSDEIAPTFWYYMPGHTVETNTFGKDMDDFYGILRADVEIAWTLNPNWSVSYYLNPRQTLGAKDDEANFEASSRLVHYANVYYNASDVTQVYANVGFDNRMSTERLTSISDTYLSAVGVSSSFFGGKLTLNPEIGVTTSLKSKGVATNETDLYKRDNISYTLATVIAL